MSKDLKKMTAELQNIKPSVAARTRGIEAAMAAFDTEFAAGSSVADQAAGEKNMAASQGLSAPTRLTEKSTDTGSEQISEDVTMPQATTETNIVPFFQRNRQAVMMLGSCAAALMVSLVYMGNVDFYDSLEVAPTPVTVDADAVQAQNNASQNSQRSGPSASPREDEITVTARKRDEKMVSPKELKALGSEVADMLADDSVREGLVAVPEAKAATPNLTGFLPAFTHPVPQAGRQHARSGLQVNRFMSSPSAGYSAVGGSPSRLPAGAISADSFNGGEIPAHLEARRVLKTPASTQERVIPSVTKQETRRVIDTPASVQERVTPAITKQVERRIETADGGFEIVTETIVVQPPTVEHITIPPVYQTVTETVVTQEASTELVTIPATYETIYVPRDTPHGDEFKYYDPNPVVAAAETSVSTFSIDVDTASYAFMRASLQQGKLPPRESVRLEEMINYFSYDYDAAESLEEPFKANVNVTPTPWNADTKLMHIGIKGYVPPASEAPRSNLVFLIDTSGSMRATNKLPLLINSFKLLLETLDEDDMVSIVTYAGSAGTVLEPTSANNKDLITEALNRLNAGGSTAGAAGLELAYQQAERNFDDEGINRVILATDGDFNVGFSSPAQMERYIEEKRDTGIFLSVLGFGQGNYNDHLMQSLAQNGNGVAAYIDTLSEAKKVLGDAAGSAIHTIAKDVKIQVEFNPDTIAEYRLLGYETRALKREDFNNDAVDAGDIGAGHTVTAIYEMTPVGSPAVKFDELRYVSDAPKTTGSDEYAFVKIRHKLPASDTSTLQSFPIGPNQDRSLRRSGTDTRFAAAVVAFGQKLRGDTHVSDLSYDDIIKLAKGARADDENGYRAEFIELVGLAKDLDQ